ncbi:hypothetical protein ACHHYP_01942 [Achlya hypogyna]|uniref:WW domain-containing protein n=1 Tax=Achlya hypogyna TaxID=1202772 RepID=A0A1V9ZSK9_ACHHY|nr:hypothetical protein ACHHYP_01942 [Achlya hypogyna]
MAAQAQAHAFQNDETFRFACKMKRELEQKLKTHAEKLARVRRDLGHLTATSMAVDAVQQRIDGLRAAEARDHARREANAQRLQRWWRRAHVRRRHGHRLLLRIHRGYIRYRYKATAHAAFNCVLFFRIDRAEKKRTQHLEFVAMAEQFSLPFAFHYSYDEPRGVLAAARMLQRWQRRRCARRDLWATFLARARLLVLAHRADVDLQARHTAAVVLQSALRRKRARLQVVRLLEARYEKCIDVATHSAFYVDRIAGTSQWAKPRLLYDRDLTVVATGTTMARESIDAWLRLETPRRCQVAASKIQGLLRKRAARRRLQLLLAATYERHVDDATNRTFYFNTKTGESSWMRPALLDAELPLALPPPRATAAVEAEPTKVPWEGLDTARRRDMAAVQLQGLFRSRAARARRRELTAAMFKKCLDAETQRYFYYNTSTGVSQWAKPLGLGATDLSVTPREATPRPTSSAVFATLTDSSTPSTAGTKYASLATPRRLEVAATAIQARYRVKRARDRLRRLLAGVLLKCYDADSQMYFYYNKKTGESSWTKPALLGTDDVSPTAVASEAPASITVKAGSLALLETPRRREAAATKLQGIYRTRVARSKLRAMIATTYQKFLDADSQTFYYFNMKTGESQWTKPRGLGSGDLSDHQQGARNAAVLASLATPRRHEMAATTIQGMFRCRVARDAARAAATATFQRCLDPDSQLEYFYNAGTGESTWTKPRWLA